MSTVNWLELPPPELDEVTRRLAEDGEIAIAKAVFHPLIERLNEERRRAFSDHRADELAADMQKYAARFALALLSAEETLKAFVVMEVNAGLRFLESMRYQGWLAPGPAVRELYEDWLVLGRLSSYCARLGAELESLTESEQADFVAQLETILGIRNPPVRLNDVMLGVHIPVEHAPHLISTLRTRREGQSPAGLFVEASQKFDSRADAARRSIEREDPTFNEVRLRACSPMSEDEIERLLTERPDTALLRLEVVDGYLIAICVCLHEGRIVTSQRFGRWSGELTERALDVPAQSIRRCVLLLSGQLAGFPVTAIGGRGETLLDRFDAIEQLWNLAPLRFQQAERRKRAGSLEIYGGSGSEWSRTRFHPVARSASSGSDQLDGRAGIKSVLERWGEAAVVSFYGHGRRGVDPSGIIMGPSIELGSGDRLGSESLESHSFGLERVELWACSSGIDTPTDPAFPLANEGHGLDYQLMCSGARSVIGTLWEVSDLVTGFLVLRYRVALALGADAAAALVIAQKWWRDVARSRLLRGFDERGAEAFIDLWKELATDVVDAAEVVEIARYIESAEARSVREELENPIAHAAYRFVGLASRS